MTVAFSGGADSVCLLLCMNELSGRIGFSLSAVHVHHGIRGEEADMDAAFAGEFCGARGIDFVCRRIPPGELAAAHGLSLEEAARLRRYEILREEAGSSQAGVSQAGSSQVGGSQAGVSQAGRRLIAVAHHRDDQAETVLLNIFRGAGLDGLRGMLPRSGDIIRPLLFAGRDEIEAFLREQGIAWRNDSTNFESIQTRNRLRNEFLPYITKEINARASEHIAALAEDVSEAADHLEREAEEWAACAADDGGRLCVPLSGMERSSPLIVRLGLRILLSRLCGSRKDITRKHLADLEALAGKQVGSHLDLPYGLAADRGYDSLIISKKCAPPAGQSEIEAAAPEEHGTSCKEDTDTEEHGIPCAEVTAFEEPPALCESGAFPAEHVISGAFCAEKTSSGRLTLKTFDKPFDFNEKLPKNRYTKWFDYDKIKYIPVVRFRRSGDKLSLNRVGSKTVKSLMIDLRIPAAERARVPLLVSGDEVLWVVGYRTNDDYRVTEDTVKILEASFEPA